MARLLCLRVIRICFVRRFVEGTIPTEVLSRDWGVTFCREEDVQKEKHVSQQSSIAAHLDKLGLLSADMTYIEFGAGKGGLSYFINIVAKGCQNVLIDRSSPTPLAEGACAIHLQFHRHRALGHIPGFCGMCWFRV